MNHYLDMIHLFGAPNGLCSSITEAKHIKAVKEPWHRSNCNKPLKQMLLTNQCLNKLAAARIYFMQRGMLDKSKLDALLRTFGLSFVFYRVQLIALKFLQRACGRLSMKKEWKKMPKTLSTSSMIQRFLLMLNWARLYVCCITCIH